MDKEKTKDLIKIMQAFLEGEAIECKLRESEDLPSNWFTHDVDYWNTDIYMYRIKPKPQYRPFKNEKECLEEMKNHQPFGWIKSKDGTTTNKFMFINALKIDGISICVNVDFSYSDSVKYYTFVDGTPFGMKVTDNCPMLRIAPKKAPK